MLCCKDGGGVQIADTVFRVVWNNAWLGNQKQELQGAVVVKEALEDRFWQKFYVEVDFLPKTNVFLNKWFSFYNVSNAYKTADKVFCGGLFNSSL